MKVDHTSHNDFLKNDIPKSTRNKEESLNSLLDDLISKRICAAVIGLGPEGRSLALELAADMEVLCFDTDKESMRKFQSTMNTVLSQLSVMTQSTTFSFIAQVRELAKAKVYFINASTDNHLCEIEVIAKLKESLNQVAQYLNQGDTVILGSSCYTGCTEEICIPWIEKASGLKCGEDIQLAYVPLRALKYPKVKASYLPLIVSSRSKRTLNLVADLIGGLSGIQPFKAKSIRHAESMLQYGGLNKNNALIELNGGYNSAYRPALGT